MAQGPKHDVAAAAAAAVRHESACRYRGGGRQGGEEGFSPINERAERKRGWAGARDLYDSARGTSRNPVEGDLSGFANNETMFQTGPLFSKGFFSFFSSFGTTLRFHEGSSCWVSERIFWEILGKRNPCSSPFLRKENSGGSKECRDLGIRARCFLRNFEDKG